MQTGLVRGSEAGLYLRFIDTVYHSTLGLRVIKQKKKKKKKKKKDGMQTGHISNRQKW
jgi:hypothetical protein